ncbi:MAG: glycosyltransferase [Actinomycetota bacterium]
MSTGSISPRVAWVVEGSEVGPAPAGVGRAVRLAEPMSNLSLVLRAIRGSVADPVAAYKAWRAESLRGSARSMSALVSRPDVLHFASVDAARRFVPAMKARPSMITIRPGSLRVSDLPVLRAATLVHCMFEADRRDATDLGVDDERVFVVPWGIDLRSVSFADGAPSPPARLLAAAPFDFRSGFEDLLVAFRDVVANGRRALLELIGYGPERDRVNYTIHDLGLQDAVVVSQGVLDESLARATAFVNTDIGGSLTSAALVALAAGLPAIHMTGGSAQELLDGVEGVQLVEADAIPRLAAALETVVDAPPPRSRAMREHVLAAFDPEAYRDEVIAMLELARGLLR